MYFLSRAEGKIAKDRGERVFFVIVKIIPIILRSVAEYLRKLSTSTKICWGGMLTRDLENTAILMPQSCPQVIFMVI